MSERKRIKILCRKKRFEGVGEKEERKEKMLREKTRDARTGRRKFVLVGRKGMFFAKILVSSTFQGLISRRSDEHLP